MILVVFLFVHIGHVKGDYLRPNLLSSNMKAKAQKYPIMSKEISKMFDSKVTHAYIKQAAKIKIQGFLLLL